MYLLLVMTKDEQLLKWYINKGMMQDENKKEYLEQPIDLVVVDRLSRRVESVLHWGEFGTLTDIERIKRLVKRENASYGEESEVVVVLHRSVGLGDILQDNQVVEI